MVPQRGRFQPANLIVARQDMIRGAVTLIIPFVLSCSTLALAQDAEDIEQRLKEMKPQSLLKKVQQRGDAKRGALVFYKSAAACAKCHEEGAQRSPLGPKLTTIKQDVADEYIINSILFPSRDIKEGYETVAILTLDGELVSGLVAEDRELEIVLRDAANLQQEVVIKKDEIESLKKSKVSMMPAGLVAALRTEREFYDLARYIIDVARGGEAVAAKLRPSADQLEVKDDTKDLDHAGIISSLAEKDFEAGQRIYKSHCVNCHGADGNKPSLATARAFGSQPLRFGADPFQMLATLTRGNGLMGPMQHLSPKERYQVIHYIREQFMKGNNPGYSAITETYLASLPKGTKSGDIELGDDRDFGPVLASQLGGSINSSLTFRLSDEVTVNYDLHRFRLGGVWQGGFLDLSQTQHYRQRGEGMPRPSGTSIPGLDHYGWQLGDSFEIPADAKPPRGPVRSDWAKYHGHYLYGDRAIMSYAIDGRDVLETIGVPESDDLQLLEHILRIAPGEKSLRLVVGQRSQPGVTGLVPFGDSTVSSQSGDAAHYVAITPNAPAKGYESNASKNLARFVLRGDEAQAGSWDTQSYCDRAISHEEGGHVDRIRTRAGRLETGRQNALCSR